jgi:hypothetical protein
MICALVPGGIALVEKSPYLLRQSGATSDESYLLGLLSSRVFDWFTRKHVELKMSYGLLNSFPVPRIHSSTGFLIDGDGQPLDKIDVRRARDRVVLIAGRLAAVDKRYADWAAEVGVQVASVTDAAKDDLICELDALVALLYGLSRVQVEKLFTTFHRGWNHQAHLDKVLAHYTPWAGRIGAAE